MLKFDASSAAENIFKPQALAACAPPSCSEKEVLSSVWGGNVAKNYFFSFLLHSRIRSFWMSYMLRREEKESRRERGWGGRRGRPSPVPVSQSPPLSLITDDCPFRHAFLFSRKESNFGRRVRCLGLTDRPSASVRPIDRETNRVGAENRPRRLGLQRS